MFEFIEKIFIGLWIVRFGILLASKSEEPIKCVSLNSWPCQARPTFINTNSNDTLYYLFTINVNRDCGIYNTIDDPSPPHKVKRMNVKVFSLTSGVKEKRFLVEWIINHVRVNVD